MGYGITQTVAPIEEPLGLDAAKQWLRIAQSANNENALIEDLIGDAREYIERTQNRQLVTASYVLTIDAFPGGYGNSSRVGSLPGTWFGLGVTVPDIYVIRIPRAPLQAVTVVTYYDASNTLQTLPATIYDVDATKDPGVMALAQYQIWPITRLRPGAVQIAFTAGYGTAAAVPRVYLRAIRLWVSWHYEHRGEDDATMKDAIDRLLISAAHGELECG